MSCDVYHVMASNSSISSVGFHYTYMIILHIHTTESNGLYIQTLLYGHISNTATSHGHPVTLIHCSEVPLYINRLLVYTQCFMPACRCAQI